MGVLLVMAGDSVECSTILATAWSTGLLIPSRCARTLLRRICALLRRPSAGRTDPQQVGKTYMFGPVLGHIGSCLANVGNLQALGDMP